MPYNLINYEAFFILGRKIGGKFLIKQNKYFESFSLVDSNFVPIL